MKITEGKVHPFVVSDFLQVYGETQLETDQSVPSSTVVKSRRQTSK